MTESTCIFDNHWNVTKISAMAHRGFNTDFHGDADDGKCKDTAIAQGHIQRRAFKRRHADLVENCFARPRIHLRNQMESRRIPQEPRLDLFWRFHPLPSHRRPELRCSHQLLR